MLSHLAEVTETLRGASSSDFADTNTPSVIISHKSDWKADEGHKMLKESAFGDCSTVDVKIAGVPTKCLLDTGSKVTTILESNFKQHFREREIQLSSANWVRLTAANGLHIPVLG